MTVRNIAILIAASLVGFSYGYLLSLPDAKKYHPNPELDAAQLRNTKSRLKTNEGKAFVGLLDDHISGGLTTLSVTYSRTPLGPLIEKQWYWSNLKTPNDTPNGYAEINNKFEIQNLQFPAKTLP